MISRLMLSLKKASKMGESGWRTNTLSRAHPGMITQIAFRCSPPSGLEDGAGTIFDEVELSDLGDGQARGRSSERTGEGG